MKLVCFNHELQHRYRNLGCYLSKSSIEIINILLVRKKNYFCVFFSVIINFFFMYLAIVNENIGHPSTPC